MSTLLVLASLKLKDAALVPQSSPLSWRWLDFIAPDDIDTICQASLCDLFQIWAYIKPIFATFQEEITFWSGDKSKHPMLIESPLDADFETMAEILSYAEFLVCELLCRLRPFLGGYFTTVMHM